MILDGRFWKSEKWCHIVQLLLVERFLRLQVASNLFFELEPLSTIYHLPFTNYHIPYTIYHLPLTNYHLPYNSMIPRIQANQRHDCIGMYSTKDWQWSIGITGFYTRVVERESEGIVLSNNIYQLPFTTSLSFTIYHLPFAICHILFHQSISTICNFYSNKFHLIFSSSSIHYT